MKTHRAPDPSRSRRASSALTAIGRGPACLRRTVRCDRGAGWLQLLLAFLIASTLPCLAVTLSVGTHSARPGTSLVRIPVRVSGGEWVSEMAAVVLVNGGGLLLGGLPGPGITAVDFTGSIWGSSDADRVVFGDQPDGAQFADPSVALHAPGQRTAANGIAFTLVLNIAGFPPGQYPIALGSTNPGIGSSRFFLAGAAVPVTTEPGILEISSDEPLVFRVDILRQAGGALALRFATETGRTYRVEASDAVHPVNWSVVSDPLSGTGGALEWPIPQNLLTGHPRRFFRIASGEASGFEVELVRLPAGPWVLRFPTSSALTYRVQSAPAIAPAAWTGVSDPLSGTGGALEWPIPQNLLTGHPRRFFRIESRSQ